MMRRDEVNFFLGEFPTLKSLNFVPSMVMYKSVLVIYTPDHNLLMSALVVAAVVEWMPMAVVCLRQYKKLCQPISWSDIKRRMNGTVELFQEARQERIGMKKEFLDRLFAIAKKDLGTLPRKVRLIRV